MRAPHAPSPPQIRLHPDAAAVEVQALFRGIVIGSRCLVGPDDAAFLIGSAKGVDAPAAELLAGPAHALVSAGAAGFTVDLTDQMIGTVIFEDRTAPLADLLRAHGPHFTPPPAARLQIACGDVAFLIGTTTAPATVPRPPLARWRDHWALAIAGLAAMVLMTLVAFIPPDSMALSGDNMASTRATVATVSIPPAPPPSLSAGGPQGGGASGGDGKPAAAPRAPRRTATSRHPVMARGATLDDVRNRGVLGILTASGDPTLDAVFSPATSLVLGPVDDLIAGGDPNGVPRGLGGDGIGVGPGNGPLAGHGPLGGIGACDRACRERIFNRDHGPGGLTRPPHQVHIVIKEDPKIRGGLDKEIVRRVIRQHLNEVKYCYEQQLPRHPDLAGRMSVQFTIAPAGNVMASLLQSSSLANVAVESCVVQAVKRWQFPQPPGAGFVMVSYPFVLVPAGSS
jgi:hypothetical protein